MRRSVGYICVLLVGLTGCFEPDEPVKPFPRGDVEVSSVEMGPKYLNQLFYSLERNEVVKTILRTDWDLSFSSEPGNSSIYLNTGNSMYAAKTNATDLNAVSDTAGLEFVWDWSNGRDDSTALVGWDTTNKVYVINIGNDLSGQPIGFVKALFKLVDDKLEITYARLKETTYKTTTLTKDEVYNRVYFSFANDQQVSVEPPKENYDLIFRQYIFYFEKEDIPYNVVGALINPYKTRVISIQDKDFLDITLSDTVDYSFQWNHDIVGYDWKEFDLNEGFYVVFPEKNFLMQTSKGFFYKFHFVDFYNLQGDRGYPTIESKLL
ncbi:MAG: HmuY family protein [Bacteroidia bacterium]|nr:HmuY family protein [Bacteroidia bacterium]